MKSDRTKLPTNKCHNTFLCDYVMMTHQKNEKSLFRDNYYGEKILRIVRTKFIFFHTMGGVRIRISEKRKEIETKFRLTK